MKIATNISNRFVTLFLASFLIFFSNSDLDHSFAQQTVQTETLDELFAQLKDPDLANPDAVEKKIWRAWRKSGSDAMDFLLKRGQDAMDAGNFPAAIGHLSALIDHAPDFAEGWNARATAFFLAEEYGLSLSDVQQTLVLNPRHFGALSGLGSILERLDKPKQALAAFKAAAELNPHNQSFKDAIARLTLRLEGTPL